MSLPRMGFLDSRQESTPSTCQAALCALLLCPLPTNPVRLGRDPLRQVKPWFHHLAVLLKSMWPLKSSHCQKPVCHFVRPPFILVKGRGGMSAEAGPTVPCVLPYLANILPSLWALSPPPHAHCPGPDPSGGRTRITEGWSGWFPSEII